MIDFGELSAEQLEASGRAEAKDFTPSDVQFFPTAPSDRNSELKMKMASRGRKSTYYLAKVILGYDKLNPRTHGALCKFLDSAGYPRRMVLMPRTHFKTTIATIAHSIRLILNNPEIRILMVADTASNAQLFMQEIRNHFQYNSLFQWLYSEIIPDSFTKGRWNNHEMQVKRTSFFREPTIDAIGAQGGIESRHYDYIKADDLVTETHIHSDVEMDKLVKWAGGLEPLLISDSCNMDFVGSRKKKGDLYEYFEKYYGNGREKRPIGPHAYLNGTIAVFSRSVVEGGKRIFPENVSWEYILRMKKHEPERYHAQLANSPKGTSLNRFREEDFRFYAMKPDGTIQAWENGVLLEEVNLWYLQRIALVDPAVAERARSSKNAMVLVAKGSGPNRYVIDYKYGHYQPDELIQTIFDWDKKWSPEFFSIERRGFQGSIKYWLHEKANRERIACPAYIEFPEDGSPRAKWAKDEHIKTLQPLTRAHFLWFDEKMLELREDLEFYPNVKYDDLLDGLAQHTVYAPYSEDDFTVVEKKIREERILRTLQGEEVGNEVISATLHGSDFDEEKFLSSFDPTGYGLKAFNN